MAELYGEKISKVELRKRVGDMSQIAGATAFTYADGKALGTRAIEVKNGSGLRFVIMLDRGMDISYAEYKSVPLAYISKTGVVSPAHYDEKDFLRSFTAGLLTTCGLTYMGGACKDEGKELGLHGRIANTPAYDISVKEEWVEGDYVITVSGKVREAVVFGENIVLIRTITTKLGDNRIYIHDVVENEGFTKSPLMVLYHMNFGYPLLSEHTVLETNCENCRPQTEVAAKGLKEACVFSTPVQDYAEQVFHRDAVTESYAELKNTSLGLAARVEFCGEQLPYLIEWKQVGEQEYVVGLEPATYPPLGRATARERGELMYIEPQEIKHFDITVSVSEG